MSKINLETELYESVTDLVTRISDFDPQRAWQKEHITRVKEVDEAIDNLSVAQSRKYLKQLSDEYARLENIQQALLETKKRIKDAMLREEPEDEPAPDADWRPDDDFDDHL